VPEYVRVFRGKKLVLWLDSGWEFEDTPVTLKPGEPAVLDCREKNRSIVKCKISDDAKSGKEVRLHDPREGTASVRPLLLAE
jgi:hypothetical protein